MVSATALLAKTTAARLIAVRTHPMRRQTFVAIVVAVCVLIIVFRIRERGPHGVALRDDGSAILVLIVSDATRVPDIVSQLFTRALNPHQVYVVTSLRGGERLSPLPSQRNVRTIAHSEFCGGGPMRAQLAREVNTELFQHVMLIDSDVEICNAWDKRSKECLIDLGVKSYLTSPATATFAEFIRVRSVGVRGLRYDTRQQLRNQRPVRALASTHRWLFAPTALLADATLSVPSRATVDTLLTWRSYVNGWTAYHPHFCVGFASSSRAAPVAERTWSEESGLDWPEAAAYVELLGRTAECVSLRAQMGVVDVNDAYEVAVKCDGDEAMRLRRTCVTFPSVVRVTSTT